MSPSAYTLAERERIAKCVFPGIEKGPISALMAACFEVAVVLGRGKSSLSEAEQEAILKTAKELFGEIR
jgi:hypothetical protein